MLFPNTQNTAKPREKKTEEPLNFAGRFYSICDTQQFLYKIISSALT